jgi:transcriptional regulator with XRE-family HTH domain
MHMLVLPMVSLLLWGMIMEMFLFLLAGLVVLAACFVPLYIMLRDFDIRLTTIKNVGHEHAAALKDAQAKMSMTFGLVKTTLAKMESSSIEQPAGPITGGANDSEARRMSEVVLKRMTVLETYMTSLLADKLVLVAENEDLRERDKMSGEKLSLASYENQALLAENADLQRYDIAYRETVAMMSDVRREIRESVTGFAADLYSMRSNLLLKIPDLVKAALLTHIEPRHSDLLLKIPNLIKDTLLKHIELKQVPDQSADAPVMLTPEISVSVADSHNVDEGIHVSIESMCAGLMQPHVRAEDWPFNDEDKELRVSLDKPVISLPAVEVDDINKDTILESVDIHHVEDIIHAVPEPIVTKSTDTPNLDQDIPLSVIVDDVISKITSPFLIESGPDECGLIIVSDNESPSCRTTIKENKRPSPVKNSLPPHPLDEGVNFRKARKALGMTMDEMAEILKFAEGPEDAEYLVDRSGRKSIVAYETGTRPVSGPTIVALECLLDRLGLDLKAIVEEPEQYVRRKKQGVEIGKFTTHLKTSSSARNEALDFYQTPEGALAARQAMGVTPPMMEYIIRMNSKGTSWRGWEEGTTNMRPSIACAVHELVERHKRNGSPKIRKKNIINPSEIYLENRKD